MYEKTGRTEYSPARALQMRVGADETRVMVSGSFNIYAETMAQAQILLVGWSLIAEAVDAKVTQVINDVNSGNDPL